MVWEDGGREAPSYPIGSVGSIPTRPTFFGQAVLYSEPQRYLSHFPLGR